ncbi:MAG: GNAT family N-acetyltransferase, partial [bacterium]
HDGIRPYVEALWGWNQDEQERRFREHFAPARASIVQVEGRDVGYLELEEHPDHLFLAGIYLSAGQRGKGLGRSLMLELMERARELAKPVRLRVLQPNPARRLYERLGFVSTGATDTHIYMEFDP